MANHPDVEKAALEVIEELKKLSPEEFRAELEKHAPKHDDCAGCPDCKGVVWNGPGD